MRRRLHQRVLDALDRVGRRPRARGPGSRPPGRNAAPPRRAAPRRRATRARRSATDCSVRAVPRRARAQSPASRDRSRAAAGHWRRGRHWSGRAASVRRSPGVRRPESPGSSRASAWPRKQRRRDDRKQRRIQRRPRSSAWRRSSTWRAESTVGQSGEVETRVLVRRAIVTLLGSVERAVAGTRRKLAAGLLRLAERPHQARPVRRHRHAHGRRRALVRGLIGYLASTAATTRAATSSKATYGGAESNGVWRPRPYIPSDTRRSLIDIAEAVAGCLEWYRDRSRPMRACSWWAIRWAAWSAWTARRWPSRATAPAGRAASRGVVTLAAPVRGCSVGALINWAWLITAEPGCARRRPAATWMRAGATPPSRRGSNAAPRFCARRGAAGADAGRSGRLRGASRGGAAARRPASRRRGLQVRDPASAARAASGHGAILDEPRSGNASWPRSARRTERRRPTRPTRSTTSWKRSKARLRRRRPHQVSAPTVALAVSGHGFGHAVRCGRGRRGAARARRAGHGPHRRAALAVPDRRRACPRQAGHSTWAWSSTTGSSSTSTPHAPRWHDFAR